jgi:catechol 2,3-dioxygenase-like lactoylglutathione lyase family enzyme
MTTLTDDIARAIRFYRGTIGLEVYFHDDGSIEFDLPDRTAFDLRVIPEGKWNPC